MTCAEGAAVHPALRLAHGVAAQCKERVRAQNQSFEDVEALAAEESEQTEK